MAFDRESDLRMQSIYIVQNRTLQKSLHDMLAQANEVYQWLSKGQLPESRDEKDASNGMG